MKTAHAFVSGILSGMPRLSGILCRGSGCLALLLLAACGNTATQDDSLEKARRALERMETADAEMYFEHYLRTHPQGDKRWYAWQQLTTIALQYRQEKTAARSYLEIMYQEFAGDPVKKRAIGLQLADLAADLRDDARAIELWEQFAEDPELSIEKKAQIQRSLSAAYLRRLDFSLATETLDKCVRSAVPLPTKADCLYDLAVTQTLTDVLPDAEKSLRELLMMREASPERRVLAIYTLADVLEQEEKYDEAFTLFEQIRSSYPNEKVIELRLSNIRPKVKNRAPSR